MVILALFSYFLVIKLIWLSHVYPHSALSHLPVPVLCVCTCVGMYVRTHTCVLSICVCVPRSGPNCFCGPAVNQAGDTVFLKPIAACWNLAMLAPTAPKINCSQAVPLQQSKKYSTVPLCSVHCT
jgi:hypothetical protein